MKYTLAVAACAALALARPIVDTSGHASSQLSNKNKRQPGLLDDLLGGGQAGGQQGGNPLAGLLGDLTGGGAPGAGRSANSTAGRQQGGGDLLESIANGGLPIPRKRKATKTRRAPEPQLDILTGLLGGGAPGAQPSNGANPLADLLGGGGQQGAGDLLGGLLGGGAPGAQPSNGANPLSGLLGGGQQGGAANPLDGLLDGLTGGGQQGEGANPVDDILGGLTGGAGDEGGPLGDLDDLLPIKKE